MVLLDTDQKKRNIGFKRVGLHKNDDQLSSKFIIKSNLRERTNQLLQG